MNAVAESKLREQSIECASIRLMLISSINTANETICDDDEDMRIIKYDDGMLIDVGFVTDEKCYYITVVASDKMVDWNNPIESICVKNKADLFDTLQVQYLGIASNERGYCT